MQRVLKRMKLNIGCGRQTLDGFTNIDWNKYDKVDIVHDLRQPIPLEDNVADYIFASHIVEHFWRWEIDDILKDWIRLLKPEGVMDIWTVDFDIMVNLYTKHKDHLNKHMIEGMRVMDFINHRIFSRDRCQRG